MIQDQVAKRALIAALKQLLDCINSTDPHRKAAAVAHAKIVLKQYENS